MAAASAEPLEPPPETPEGTDYVAEPADTLEDSSVEWSVGAAGQQGAGPHRRRRVSFSSDSLSGALRSGEDDPLAGGTVGGHSLGGEFGFGRFAPRWGRGLVIGGAAEPWSLAASDRGSGSTFRGRTGEGAWFRRESAGGLETFCARFASGTLAGLAGRRGPWSAGLLSGGRGTSQASLAAAGEVSQTEVALDRRGRWRAEGLSHRALGPLALAMRARLGLAGFRSLAEPLRSGPAHALTLGADARGRGWRAALLLGVWRFAREATGARLGLEFERRAGSGSFALGFEEQHGARRQPTPSSPRDQTMRQGTWAEWRTGSPVIALAVRHELWGEAAFARQWLRRVLTARLDATLPGGARLGVTHSVYRSRRGESLYLPERESDRLVLRALSGAGQRTRCELTAPAAGGALRGGIGLTSSRSPQLVRTQWTLDWTRRIHLRHGRA